MKRRIYQILSILPPFTFLLAVLLAATSAKATTPTPTSNQFRVCLRADMTGFVDRTTGDRANGADLPMYGIRYRVEKFGSVVQNWADSDSDDGCFLLPKSSGYYVIKVKPRSAALTDNNTVRVNSSSGSVKVFAVTTPWIGSGSTTYEVIFPSKGILRIYTVLAFAIERAFTGRYANHDLVAWKEKNSSPCATGGCVGCTRTCDVSGDLQIVIDDDHHTRRFVIIHEYGHVALAYGVGSARENDCGDLGVDDGNPAGMNFLHRLRGREASSCAAVEGYAHFVSGDVFNWHGGGGPSPMAEVEYVDGGVWDLGGGSGGCPGSYPLQPGTIYPAFNRIKQYVDCTPSGNEPSDGVEMDWARLWWAYHLNTSYAGSPRGHGKMHDDIDDAGPWGTSDAYDIMLLGLGPNLALRWAGAANAVGVCDGGSC